MIFDIILKRCETHAIKHLFTKMAPILLQKKIN